MSYTSAPTPRQKRHGTKLKRLRVSRVDLVDRGANPGAHILLAKRDQGADPADVTDVIDQLLADGDVTLADELVTDGIRLGLVHDEQATKLRKRIDDVTKIEKMIDDAVAKETKAMEEATPVVKAARVRKGLTQEQLAERVHVDQSYIARIESGERSNPSFWVTKAIAEELDLTTEERIKFDDEMYGEYVEQAKTEIRERGYESGGRKPR